MVFRAERRMCDLREGFNDIFSWEYFPLLMKQLNYMLNGAQTKCLVSRAIKANPQF